MLERRRRERFHESTEVRLLAGEDRIGLCGRFRQVGHHQHATPALVIGVDGPLDFVGTRTHRSRAVLLSAGFSHAVQTHGGRLAMFVLPPGMPAALGGLPLRDLPRLDRWVELGRAVHDGTLTDFTEVDASLTKSSLGGEDIDDRLRRALIALGSALDENVRFEEIALQARLSPSRLMALAQEQLGVPLRTYRRWLRAFRVARAYAAGHSLTEAALAAGFSSSAHLSSSTRAHFGIRPSDVLTPHNRPAIVAVDRSPTSPGA